MNCDGEGRARNTSRTSGLGEAMAVKLGVTQM